VLGERLRELRKERGLTQEDVSKLLDVSERTIGYYESEERTPDPKSIITLANFFDVSTDYLLGQTHCRNPYIKSEKEIEDIMHDVIDYLKKSGELLLDGKPVKDITIDGIIVDIETALKTAKANNK